LVAAAALDQRRRLRRLQRRGTRSRNHHETPVRPLLMVVRAADVVPVALRRLKAALRVADAGAVASVVVAAAADRKAPSFKHACSSALRRCRPRSSSNSSRA
jgi:hypothetical protein